jgi:hypothetical protein
VAQPGSALGWGPSGRRFKSDRPDFRDQPAAGAGGARPAIDSYDVGVRRVSRLLSLLAIVALFTAPAAALADGDPASDVLLSQPYYLPYQPVVSKDVTAKLKRVIAATEKVRLPMKVAVIATPTDLGAVPDLFGRPQQYAGFLYSEVQPAFQRQFGLVVVMPAGIGLAGTINSPKLAAAIRDVPISSGEDSNGFARAGGIAMEKVARAAGKPIPEIFPIKAGGGGSGFGARAVIVTLELLGLLLGVLLALQARTRRRLRPVAPAPAARPSTPAS